jgi:hypothetical protein
LKYLLDSNVHLTNKFLFLFFILLFLVSKKVLVFLDAFYNTCAGMPWVLNITDRKPIVGECFSQQRVKNRKERLGEEVR